MTKTLSREEIMAMPAGREMDALVAQRVFDHALVSDLPEGVEWHGSRGEVPFYSTDIKAAWEVLGVVKGWLFSKRMRCLNELSKVVTMRVSPKMNTQLMQIAWPDVLVHLQPQDICRAALLASLPG